MAEKEDILRTNWNTTDCRFVAFLDLLGFKDKVMRKAHEDIYEELRSIAKLKKLVETKPNLKNKKRYCDVDVYVVSFSDSIVLFSKNDSVENFEYFLFALTTIFSGVIEKKIALKGGMACGEISLNQSQQIYFGQPIIDAYSIEEDVNYMGVVAHSSIDEYLNAHKDQLEESAFVKQLLFKEKSYLKSGQITHLNLDWFIFSQTNLEQLGSDDIIEAILINLDMFYNDVSGSARRYIDNTKEFLRTAHEGKKINLKRLNIENIE